MKLEKLNLTALAIATALLGTTGCRAIGALFKAGVWFGVIVIAFLALVAFAVTRLFARPRPRM
jgi:hypothetical protein